jgi:hypothetical protein
VGSWLSVFFQLPTRSRGHRNIPDPYLKEAIMNTSKRRTVPLALTLAAGITGATLVFAAPTLATAVERADTAVMTAKLAHLRAAKAAAAMSDAYAAAGGPSTTQDVKIGDSTGRIWYKQISSRKLLVDGKDTGWIARYDVHVRRADGKVVFDKNLSVYKLAWFANKFDANKRYANEADLMQAIHNADSQTEIQARATFKKRIGSLGQFVTTSGEKQTPYDFSQHPGSKYIPLDYND